MKKIRITETKLISLISKVIKETEEDMGIKDKQSPSSLIQELGTKTYLDIIRGNKNELFSKILEEKHIQISTPDDEWFETNIDNLTIIDDIFKSKKGIIWWRDGSKSTFEERIQKLIDRCENRDFVAFIEKNENKKVWSLLNKIDTNYTNWDRMINDRLRLSGGGGIGDGDRLNAIENFFKQRPLSEVLSPERLIKFREYEKRLGSKIETLSFADIDLLDAFMPKNSTKLDEIFAKIKYSTSIGDQMEFEFLNFLRNSEKPGLEIYHFSTPGSVVDTAFGIDCAINLDGVWYAVQLKGGKTGEEKAKNAFVHTLGINSISIYKKNGEFYYYTPFSKEEGKSFKKDFGF